MEKTFFKSKNKNQLIKVYLLIQMALINKKIRILNKLLKIKIKLNSILIQLVLMIINSNR